jgi:hypothetical protein
MKLSLRRTRFPFELMDHFKVAKTRVMKPNPNKPGKRMRLDLSVRIDKFAKKINTTKYSEMLHALRVVGNLGTHGRSVHRGACGASLQTPRAGRRTHRQILRRLSPVCLTQLHTGLRGFSVPAFRAPSHFCGGNQRHTSGAFRAARTRSAGFFFSSRAGASVASVARMERSAIRVIVSGAGKSRISLRFMRATDSCAGVFLLPWREKVASPR